MFWHEFRCFDVIVSENFWPGVQLMSKCIRFRQRKVQEKVIVSEIKRLNLKSLSVKELKKKNEKTKWSSENTKWSSDSDEYFPVLQFFIRLTLKILWIIFEIYLIWLGWVWEVLSLQVCVLLSPAVSILNSGGQEGRSDRGPLYKSMVHLDYLFLILFIKFQRQILFTKTSAKF